VQLAFTVANFRDLVLAVAGSDVMFRFVEIAGASAELGRHGIKQTLGVRCVGLARCMVTGELIDLGLQPGSLLVGLRQLGIEFSFHGGHSCTQLRVLCRAGGHLALRSDVLNDVLQLLDAAAVARDQEEHKLAPVLPDSRQQAALRQRVNGGRGVVDHLDQIAGHINVLQTGDFLAAAQRGQLSCVSVHHLLGTRQSFDVAGQELVALRSLRWNSRCRLRRL